jgi:hypothetical protein
MAPAGVPSVMARMGEGFSRDRRSAGRRWDSFVMSFHFQKAA